MNKTRKTEDERCAARREIMHNRMRSEAQLTAGKYKSTAKPRTGVGLSVPITLAPAGLGIWYSSLIRKLRFAPHTVMHNLTPGGAF